ncbi:MAG: 2-oxo acid dehydrogenase subunit E2 [Chloroflexi bacterium]|nr:2-oxo acid dehydrogenase subunit E2 [Chloroflexota bacterium]
MPKFGMTQESGTIVRWLLAEGDRVEAGDPVLEVETDKAIMEVEAPTDGVLVGISAEMGQEVPVATTIAYIATPGEQVPEPDEWKPAKSENQAQPVVTPAPPISEAPAASIGPDGKEGVRSPLEDVRPGVVQRVESDGRTRATPAARRLARERGVSLADFRGSGPKGRVQAVDVLAAPVRAGLPGGQRSTSDVMWPPIESVQSGDRPALQYSMTIDVDSAELLALQNRLVGALGGRDLSLMAILVRACGWLLHRRPGMIAVPQSEREDQDRAVDIGIAHITPVGWVVPVLHQVELMGIGEIAVRLSELGERAEQGRLMPEDANGGAFAVVDLGRYRIQQFAANVTPPWAAVLAMGCVVRQTVVVAGTTEDKAAINPRLTLTLSVDSRAVDPAVAMMFLQDLHEVLECPSLLLC